MFPLLFNQDTTTLSLVLDDTLNTTSIAPVQNNVITNELNLKVNSSQLAQVAFSGSYNDLINKPDILENPTIISSNKLPESASRENIANCLY